MKKTPQRLALALEHHRAGRLAEAAEVCEQAVRDDPKHPDALHLSGLLALERRDHSRAIERLLRAARMQPSPLFLANLAAALLEPGRLTEAIDSCDAALRMDASWAPAYINKGQAKLLLGAADEALASLRLAQTFEPSPALAQTILYTLNFLPGASARDVADEHRRWGQQQVDAAAALIAHPNDPDPERRLRVGYLSADLRQHPVAAFVEPLLRAHDRQKIEVRCYAHLTAPDAVSERLRALSDAWVPVHGLSDQALAERIRADGVDVLVELGGHTEDSRLRALAHRPAPVQVSWLGYPNTTGLPTVDYRLTDALADPPGDADALHTERLERLGRCSLCYGPPAGAPEPSPPPCGADGPFTFGSFNNLAKLNARVIEVWARILGKVPGSRLLLKAAPLADAGVRAHYEGLLGKHGIEPSRLRLLGRVQGTEAHLAVYGQIDVALDPFPYNGATTTCEALWMGVPVVALEGDRHAARVSADLLRTVGHPDLIARSTKDYVALAVRLAQDRPRAAALRAALRGRVEASPLRDEAGFARAVEEAYRGMWRRWCAQHGAVEE